MVFLTGNDKIVTIAPFKAQFGHNALEMILRESGRFLIRGKGSFLALSEKKTKNITVTGAIGAGLGDHLPVYEYDAAPEGQSFLFSSSDVFPQDLLNEIDKDLNKIQVYGMCRLVDMTISQEPADALCYLKRVDLKDWIGFQAMTSWNQEDSIQTSAVAYMTTPEQGALLSTSEGVAKLTSIKRLVPFFTPLNLSFEMERTKDKLWMYDQATVFGKAMNSVAGGSNIVGSVSVDTRLIIGQGYAREEVEELLAPSQ